MVNANPLEWICLLAVLCIVLLLLCNWVSLNSCITREMWIYSHLRSLKSSPLLALPSTMWKTPAWEIFVNFPSMFETLSWSICHQQWRVLFGHHDLANKLQDYFLFEIQNPLICKYLWNEMTPLGCCPFKDGCQDGCPLHSPIRCPVLHVLEYQDLELFLSLKLDQVTGVTGSSLIFNVKIKAQFCLDSKINIDKCVLVRAIDWLLAVWMVIIRQIIQIGLIKGILAGSGPCNMNGSYTGWGKILYFLFKILAGIGP